VTVPVPVVAAVICRDGRYLLARRPEEKRHGGLWEFPGGKVREGESTLDAVRRELTEEMGLDAVSLGATLFSTADPGAPFVIEFVEAAVRGEPEAREHSQIAWVTPNQMVEMPLAPADALFASRLVERQGTPTR
jgi:mutator protein MutT